MARGKQNYEGGGLTVKVGGSCELYTDGFVAPFFFFFFFLVDRM